MSEHNRRPPTQGKMSLQQFADAMRRGDIRVLDRLGQHVKPGNQIIFQSGIDTIYEVIDVRPILDPRQPQGLAKVSVAVTFDIPVPVNQPFPPLLVIGQAPAGASLADAVRGVEREEQSSSTTDSAESAATDSPTREHVRPFAREESHEGSTASEATRPEPVPDPLDPRD